jgi:ArsR family transcriptional regulator
MADAPDTDPACLLPPCRARQPVEAWRAAQGCCASVYDLTPALGLAQPTVSHHLKVLTEAGLLTRERRGQQAWFTLVPERLAQIGRIFA